MKIEKLSCREWRWLALLIEAGVSLERAQELVGKRFLPPAALPEDRLPAYIRTSCHKQQFESRSKRRGRFRCYGWMTLWGILVALFALCRRLAFPVEEIFRGMNLSLPAPTRWFIEPNWLLLLGPFLICYVLRNRSELRHEEQGHDGWAFLSALAAGHRPEAALHLLRTSQGFQEVLTSASLSGRCVQKTALAWVHCLEWDLEWKNWARRWKWFFALYVGSIATAGFVALALGLPFYQLCG